METILQSVVSFGAMKKLQLPALNWDILLEVVNINVYVCTVDPRLSEQQWPEDSKNHADK